MNDVVKELLTILQEARRDRYMQMFPSKFIDPEFQGPARRIFEEDVDKARQILKKENWCVWYLRWRRIDIVLQYGFEGAAQAFIKQVAKESGFSERRVETEALNFTNNKKLGTANDMMYRHYMSLMDKIPEMGNFNPGWMDAATVFSKLREMEKAWMERTKRFVPDIKVSDRVEELIDFGNGIKWFNLHEDGCRAEADAMGHCSTGGHPGDINLSLRRRGKMEGKGEGWIPELTFIWNEKTGILGEMKGPDNSKPKPEFHKYITKLLELDMIKGICPIPPGGWLPGNNFKWEDLEEGDQKRLFEKKPTLAPPDYILEVLGINETSVNMVNRILESMESELKIGMLPKGLVKKTRWGDVDMSSHVSVAEYATVEEFLEQWRELMRKSSRARWAYNVVTGHNDLDFSSNYKLSSSEVNEFLTEVLTENEEVTSRLGSLLASYVKREGIDWEEYDEEVDYKDPYDVARILATQRDLLGDLGDAVYSAVERSSEDGWRSGTEGRIYREFKEWIEDLGFGPFTLLTVGDGYILERGCFIAVSKRVLMTEVLTPEALEEYNGDPLAMFRDGEEVEDMSDSRDYSDYDEKAAMGQFVDYWLDSELGQVDI